MGTHWSKSIKNLFQSIQNVQPVRAPSDGAVPLYPTDGHLRQPLSKDAFEARLRHFLTSDGMAVIGLIRLVDLITTCERLARHWDHIGEMVHMLVQMIISHHLKGEDTYIRLEEHDYAILFPGLALAEAEQVCARIAKEVLVNLLGASPEKPTQGLRIVVYSAGRSLFEAGSDLVAALHTELRKAEKKARSDFFGGTSSFSSTPSPAASSNQPQTDVVEAKFIDDNAFEKWLDVALAERDSVCVAAMQILDLEPIQRRFEAYWDSIGQKVMAIVQMIIEKHLENDDRYTPWMGKGFAIFFGQSTGKEAQKVCIRIAEEIVKNLAEFGPGARRLNLDHIVVDLDRTVMPEKGPRLPKVQDILLEELLDPSRRIRIEVLPGIGSQKTIETAERLPADLHFVYWPIWDTQRNAITAYTCTPRCTRSDGATKQGYDYFHKQVKLSLLAELDETTLRKASQALNVLFQKGQRLLLVCPVHYYTLTQTSAGKRYFQRCESIAHELRKYLSFELVGLPNEISTIFIRDVVQSLHPYCRSIVAQFPLERSHFENLARTGIHAVGADVHGRLSPESKTIHLMANFTVGAEAAGVQSYIFGLHALSLVTAAVSNGFNYVAGAAIQREAHAPEHAIRFEAEDLFSHLIARQKITIIK